MSQEAPLSDQMAVAAAVRSEPSDHTERLREMFDAHYPFVWRSLRRLGIPPAAADDAAQEVFLVATRRIADVRHGSERPFLFGTALRVASDARRTSSRRYEVEDEGAVDAALDPTPNQEALTDQKRARELLDQTLLEMELDLRAVFVLFEIEELTMAEIAECLSIPSGTVASRLRRARTQFHQITNRIEARRSSLGGRS